MKFYDRFTYQDDLQKQDDPPAYIQDFTDEFNVAIFTRRVGRTNSIYVSFEPGIEDVWIGPTAVSPNTLAFRLQLRFAHVLSRFSLVLLNLDLFSIKPPPVTALTPLILVALIAYLSITSASTQFVPLMSLSVAYQNRHNVLN